MSKPLTSPYKPLALLVLLFVALAWLATPAAAQEPHPDTPAPLPPPLTDTEWKLLGTGSDGYTVWRQEVNSACLYSDHSYTLNVPTDPAEMDDIIYSMTNYDVDYNSPNCPTGPERDNMTFNGNFLGILTGANDSWSVNSWTLTRNQVISGTNQIHIDTDATGPGCWCVGVGYVEVRAKVGFRVLSHTPQNDDKNRDFHAAALDLRVKLLKPYDTATLNNNTFKLEYRNQAGAWQQVAGTFTQVAPDEFRFVPSADLKDGVRYRATVVAGANGLKSTAGAELEAEEQWYFWTVPNLDITDAFDYGSGSVCPPSTSPCPGAEVAVFQVGRNQDLVQNKDAVARLYLRWKAHADVFDDDEVKELRVQTSLPINGTDYINIRTIRRPDGYTAADRTIAAHSLNIYHNPGTDTDYAITIQPIPQTNATLVEYDTSRNLTSTGDSPSITFRYYFLKDGLWAGGVPGAAKTDGIALMTAGSQLILDMFPTNAITFTQQGEYSIGYTVNGTNTVSLPPCGTVREVTCPGVAGAQSELMCAYNNLQTLRGGNKFVAATAPSNLCNGATGFAIGGTVFVHQSGTSANDGTVAHEVGHIYTLGHENSPNDVEGFQVRTRTNRSFIENPTQALSLMHTTVQLQGTQWIRNDQYRTLITQINRVEAIWNHLWGREPQGGPYLIISGFLNPDNSISLAPAFQQAVPNDLPDASGSCTISLLDASDTVLESGFVTPGVEIEGYREDGSHFAVDTLQGGLPDYFSISLPYTAARKIRVACAGAPTYTYTATAATPTVTLSGVTQGQEIGGTRNLTWTGSDTDGGTLYYQLQSSRDGGTTWLPLTPLGTVTSWSMDTFLLPNGTMTLRVLVTDGFNTGYVSRDVTVRNPLDVYTTLPAPAATNVSRNTTIQYFFFSPVDPTTVLTETVELYSSEAGFLPGTVSYDANSRILTFTPTDPLQGNTTYTAYLRSGLMDIYGNPASTQSLVFTTEADTTAPQIQQVNPNDGALEVPLNALVAVRFSEAMSETSISPTTFQVFNPANSALAGTVTYTTIGTDTYQALWVGTAPFASNTRYRARLNTTITDAVGNPLEQVYEWYFTTGDGESLSPVRIIGNYSDEGNDTNGDGRYESLSVFVDVEVRTDGFYNLNARLKDSAGRLIEWATTEDQSYAPGVYRLELQYPGSRLYSQGEAGPYILDSLYFYDAGDPSLADLRYNAYQTFPYAAADFNGVLQLATLPDQLLTPGEVRDNAFNLEDYTTHETLPTDVLTYTIFANSNPAIIVTIDAENNIDITAPTEVTASDVTIRAEDADGNFALSTFRITISSHTLYLPLLQRAQ